MASRWLVLVHGCVGGGLDGWDGLYRFCIGKRSF